MAKYLHQSITNSVPLLAVCSCVSPNICIKALLTAELTCLLPANLDKYGHQAGARVIYDHESGDCYDENSHIWSCITAEKNKLDGYLNFRSKSFVTVKPLSKGPRCNPSSHDMQLLSNPEYFCSTSIGAIATNHIVMLCIHALAARD